MTLTRKQYKKSVHNFFKILETPKEERTLAQCMSIVRGIRPRSIGSAARIRAHVPDALKEQCEAMSILEGIL